MNFAESNWICKAKKKEEGSSAADSVTDVTDVTDGWKKAEGRRQKAEGRRQKINTASFLAFRILRLIKWIYLSSEERSLRQNLRKKLGRGGFTGSLADLIDC